MQISVSSIMNTFFTVNLLVLILLVLLACRHLTRYISVYTIILCCVAIIARLLFPLEFSFTQAVPVENILPPIYVFIVTTTFTAGQNTFSLYQLFAAVWFIISAILIGNSVITYIRTRKSLLKLEEVECPEIIGIYEKVNNSFLRKKNFILVSSDVIHTPLVFGIRKPIIALPRMRFTPKELSYIFSHELCHYYKKHLHIKVLAELITDIYFWNPFVYLMKYLLNKALEYYTDAYVTDSINEFGRIEYLECLVKIAKTQYGTTKKTPYISAFSVNLKDRSNKIIIEAKAKNRSIYSIMLLFVFMFFLLLSYLYIWTPSSIPKQIQEETFSLDESNSYYLKTKDNSFALYINGEYITTITQSLDPNIPIREEIKCEKN